MTWGEIQIESLKKMFLNKEALSVGKLEEYKSDKKYKIYLDGMPQACNEAINQIINYEPIIKAFELQKTNENALYHLDELIKGYKKFTNIVSEGYVHWDLLTKNIIRINEWKNGNIDIYYESYPEAIKNDTSSEKKIELEETFARIIPLYIAGELYKDDDLSLSTMYMNEFLNNLSAMANNDNFINNRIETIYGME